MEEDNRSDEKPEGEEPDAGWYFDLPQGAWERQEAKNRELRESVRRNINDDPPKDVFGGVKKDDDAAVDDPMAAWSALQEADGPPRPATWTFAREADDEPVSPTLHIVETEDIPESDYSTEPDILSPTPFKLRVHRNEEVDDAPRLKPPAGLFGYQESHEVEPDARDADAAVDEASERPSLRAFSSRIARNDEPEEPTPFVRGDRPAPADPERPPSRWGDLFGEKASDGANMLEGMRNWAHRDDDDGTPVAAGTTAPQTPATPPANDDVAPVIPIPIRVQRHDEDEPPLVNSDDPKTRWDHMFARTASEDSGLLDGMRSWATTDGEEESAASPRVRLERDIDAVDESMFKPFEWEAGDPSPGAPAGFDGPREEPETQKKGLFGRLFGKKKKAEEQGSDAAYAQGAWLPSEDSPHEYDSPPLLPSDEFERRSAWVGRADGAANRFLGQTDEPPWPPVTAPSAAARASGWSLEGENEDDLPVRLPQDDLPVPAEGEEDAGHPGSWRDPEPSDDDQTRFSELSTWFANRGRDDTVDEEPAEAVDSAPDLESDRDVPALDMWEPAPWETAMDAEDSSLPPVDLTALTPGEAGADGEEPVIEPDDDSTWDPEPVVAMAAADTPALAELAASEDEPSVPVEVDARDGVAVGALDEQETGSEPLVATTPDEDPWASVQAVDDEPEHDAVAEAPADQPQFEAAPAAEDLEMPASEPEGQATDDPWATYLHGRVAGKSESEAAVDEQAMEPPTEPAGERESLWDSAFARVHGEAMAEEEPAAEAAADDPWAAITQATGYDEHAGGVPGFRASAEVESALHRYEAEREAEEAYHATAEDAFPSPVDADMPPAALPAWDDSSPEDDTVLRAFQAHASSFDDDGDDDFGTTTPSTTDTDSLVFDDLLGVDAEEIVAEASQPAADNRYFGRMQGWAPQRTHGDRQPFPWEKDAQEPARTPEASEEEATSLDGWSRSEEAPVPWNPAPKSAVSGHTDAPSVRRKSRSRVLVREIVETGLLALLVFLSVRASFQNFKVDGYSMWPTLDDGEYLIVNKLAYSEVDMDRLSNFIPFVDPGDDPSREVFGGPARGDIVVLKDPRETDTDLIKRIIGMPGETLEIVDGKVYINEMLLIEPYIKEEWHDDKEKIAIPDGFYFVMGDNRNNSMDSRSSQIALISKDLLIGKAMLTYWPREKFGLAPNDDGNISEKDGRPVVTTERVLE